MFLLLAPKLRRRRPTTSSPKDSQNHDNQSAELRKHISSPRKTFTVENKNNIDQTLATSVNRFRIRTKVKSETVPSSMNISDYGINREKPSKDGYKVNYYKLCIDKNWWFSKVHTVFPEQSSHTSLFAMIFCTAVTSNLSVLS